MKQKKTENFEKLCDDACFGCKIDCCKHYAPFLSEYDKIKIRKIIKNSNLFKGNYFNTKNKLCPFYNNQIKDCKIHSYKPLDCQIYPYSFWFEMGRLELWLDHKCPLSKKLISNKSFYNQALKIAKKELPYWSEGEIFAYLMGDFNIDKFKKQVGEIKRRYFQSKSFKL